MWKSIAVVLGLSLVGCVDGEEAPVTVTSPAPTPAPRALAARQMPTLPSLPELPEDPTTSDPWAPNYVAVQPELDPDEEAAIAKQYAESEGELVDEHDYENEGAGEHYFHDDPDECPEGCGEEPYTRDEANDPINLDVEEQPLKPEEIEDCH